MDGSAFDRVVRDFVAGGSRRRLLGLLVGLPLLGLLSRSDVAAARPGRKAQRHHARHQHRHAKTQRGKAQRDDAHAEACIPTGQRCPSKKPRGKHAKKLGCTQCCQGRFVTDATGKTVCGCQPNGGPCTSATTASCCSGFCGGTSCQAAPCSAAQPCPACQRCGADGKCAPVANGTACEDGNACTQTDNCQGGVCVGGNPVVCLPAPNECQNPGTCNPATGQCSGPTPKPNRTLCSGGNICCNGACCDGCCSAGGTSGGTCGICRVFVTSTIHPSFNLGGLSGADGICQSLANAAARPGTYKAWLSTGNGPNECPANGRFRQSAQPYVLLDVAQTQIAANWAALTDGTLDHVIDVTQTGSPVINAGPVWTNTATNGFEGSLAKDCGNWMANSDGGGVGDNTRADSNWTDWTDFGCGDIYPLYCFQQD